MRRALMIGLFACAALKFAAAAAANSAAQTTDFPSRACFPKTFLVVADLQRLMCGSLQW
jgi:hypothetical protein